MKAKVDQNACVGSEDCVNSCPEVFKMDGGKAFVHADQVPKEAEDKCRLAKDSCPAAAISLEG